jgi:hypothetical protein
MGAVDIRAAEYWFPLRDSARRSPSTAASVAFFVLRKLFWISNRLVPEVAMMRFAVSILIGLAVFASPTLNAQAVTCKDGSTATKAGRGACSHHGGIASAKASSRMSQAPAAPKAGESVSCRDGTTTNVVGRGACSHHGGVGTPAQASATTAPAPAPVGPARWSTGPVVRSNVGSTGAPSSRRREDNDPTGAIAQCKDGMYSHAANRRGACSRHHGVAKWMP